MATLCQIYWYPVYAYIRRRGLGVHEAEDLTQGFFAKLLEKGYLSHVDQSRGKFRSFLLTAVKHYLANEWQRKNAQKRGGGVTLISLDFQDAEGRYRLEPSGGLTPEQIFERRWAMTVLETALGRTRQWYVGRNRLERFERLKACLDGTSPKTYRELGDELHMTEAAVRQEVARMRSRYRQELHGQIAETLADPLDTKEEMRRLAAAVAL